MAKIKALISCAVTKQLICPSFSHWQKSGFLMMGCILLLWMEKKNNFFFCIWENKDTDQIGSNCTADLISICFHYIDSTICHLFMLLAFFCDFFCTTWSETLNIPCQKVLSRTKVMLTTGKKTNNMAPKFWARLLNVWIIYPYP